MAALKKIEDEYSGSEENYLKGQVKGFFYEQKQALADARDRISDSLVKMVDEKTPYKQVRDYIEQNKDTLGIKEYVSSKDFLDRAYEVGKYAPKPQRDPFADMMMFFQAKDELQDGKYQNKNEFIKAYKGLLPSHSISSLVNMAFYGKGSDRPKKDPYNKYNPLNTVGDMIKDYRISLSPKEEQRFYSVFSDVIHSKTDEKKRELTPDEIESAAKDLLTKEVVKRDYNVVEKFLMGAGADKAYFSPDEVTEGYKYQVEAALKEGVKYDADTGTYYYRDSDGNLKGWTPDYKPELKSIEKRAIKDSDFYKEVGEKDGSSFSAKSEVVGSR